jgi:hypothetical protein
MISGSEERNCGRDSGVALTLYRSSGLIVCQMAFAPASSPEQRIVGINTESAWKRNRIDEVATLRIRVLYFDDCPNYEPAVELVRRTAEELGVDANIEHVYIDSTESARANRFLGSPTIQVEGVDIDPAARDREDFGVSCRRYGNSGVPPREMIVNALRGNNGGQR